MTELLSVVFEPEGSLTASMVADHSSWWHIISGEECHCPTYGALCFH